MIVISGGVQSGRTTTSSRRWRTWPCASTWRVALQPGGPTWFGERGGRLVFGLPGNPVSAFVTFSLFARPAIAALQGANADSKLESEAVLGVAVTRHRTRRTGPASPARASRRGDHCGPQRSPGLAHPHVTGASRRTRPDPSRRGRAPGRQQCRARVPAALGKRSESARGSTRPVDRVRVVVVAARRRRRRLPARAVLVSPHTSTVVARDGAVRSVQWAEF